MGAVDIKSLLEAITQENPCGIDLRNDPRTFELDNTARGKPARLETNKEIPAEEPNWAQVRELAESILKTSKDLRVAMHLTRSLVKTEGYSGLAAGFALLRGLIIDQWEFVYPRLDPEDKDDPTERLNILEELNDPEKLLLFVRMAPIVTSREFGRFSLRDYELSSGKQPAPSGVVAVKTATIDACFQAAELDSLKATSTTIQNCLDAINAIVEALPDKLANKLHSDEIITENVAHSDAGFYKAPDFSPLTQNLRNAHKLVEASVKLRDGANGGTVVETEIVQPVGTQPAAGNGPGSIRNRDDCIKALDLVADYFRKHERSSPIPLLLERAKRLMTKDFLEIMQDLAPDGVSQASKVLGTEAKKT